MPSHPRRSSPPLTFVRSLGLASVALLAGCSYGDGAPMAPSVATTTLAPAYARPCRSNDECAVDRGGGLCMPKAATKELSDAEDFLERAMTLHDLVASLGDTSSSSEMTTIERQVQADLSTYSLRAQGRLPAGADDARGSVVQGPPTDEQMQDAAWLQSGATQAYVIIRGFKSALSKAPLTTDAQRVSADITGDGEGLHLDQVIGDLQTFLHDLDVVVAPIRQLAGYREADGSAPGLKTGAGALAHYLDPVLAAIQDAVTGVQAFLDASASSELRSDMIVLSRRHDLIGQDGNTGVCTGSP